MMRFNLCMSVRMYEHELVMWQLGEWVCVCDCHSLMFIHFAQVKKQHGWGAMSVEWWPMMLWSSNTIVSVIDTQHCRWHHILTSCRHRDNMFFVFISTTRNNESLPLSSLNFYSKSCKKTWRNRTQTACFCITLWLHAASWRRGVRQW